MESDWLKAEEVAAALRVHTHTVYGMVERGELPARRVGRLLRIHRSAVNPSLARRPGRPRLLEPAGA